jgi:MYXO-CTERM domain-containing protein
MQCKISASLVAGIAGTLIAASASAAPDIGGSPLHTEEDYFTGGPWAMTVFSYVFDDDADVPDGFNLNSGQFLFIYLLDGDEDNAEISVDTFSVGNPNLAPIVTVGFSTFTLPDGYDMNDREDPFLFGYSGPAQASIFTYAGNPNDPFSTLDPDEWSLVYYVAETDGWTLGSANGSGGGISDSHLVPVPIPTPGALALLAFAGLASRRRRG